MKLYSIYKDEELIGHSKLERGDPPMDVAFGDFITAPSFQALRSQAETLDADSRRWQGLTLKCPSGEIVECMAGTVIIEYGDLSGPLLIEVSCLGIPYPKYEELFPHHVEGYEKHFD